jgi:prepilin-type N-terminal cleavage/methylation domain-containing protein
MHKKYQAFTLIELLVVIAIVGILSGFIFVSMTSAINSAKDAKRKADLSSIEKALLVYGANHGGAYPYSALDTYPCNLTGSTNLCTNTNLSSALSPYLGVLPTDPNGTSYTYTGVADASSFILSGTLSNGNSYYYSSPNLTWTEATETWLTGWTYRKSHSVGGSTLGTQTNYQMKLSVHRGTGIDSGQDVYIDAAKLDAGYKDLRFTGSDKSTLLDYWIEFADSSSATVWVEVPSIPASPAATTIYIYYGNASAGSASNGNNTFIFFDDFAGASLDGAKWLSSGTVVVSGSEVSITTNGGYIKTQTASYGEGTRMLARASRGDDTNFNLGYDNASKYAIFYETGSGGYVRQANGGAASYGGSNLPTGYKVWEIARQTSNSVYYIQYPVTSSINGTLIASLATNYPTDSENIRLYNANTNSPVPKLDWIFVSKYLTPEPSHGAWGAEASL